MTPSPSCPLAEIGHRVVAFLLYQLRVNYIFPKLLLILFPHPLTRKPNKNVVWGFSPLKLSNEVYELNQSIVDIRYLPTGNSFHRTLYSQGSPTTTV